LSIKLMTKVWEQAPYRAEKLLVLLALADWANDKGECWPYHRQVAVKARISEGGALKIIQSLIADGVLEIIEQATGRGNYNIYRLHPENFSSVPKSNPAKIKGNPETPFIESNSHEKGNGKGNPETPFISKKGNPDESPKLPFRRKKGNPDGEPYKEEPSCNTPSGTVTHTEAASPRVRGSRFDRKTLRAFADYLASQKRIHNPAGYTRAIRDGSEDDEVQAWLDSKATGSQNGMPYLIGWVSTTDPECEYCGGSGFMTDGDRMRVCLCWEVRNQGGDK